MKNGNKTYPFSNFIPPPARGGGTAIYGLYRQDKRHDNVLFGVLYSLMYIDLNIYFMTILTLFFIRPKKLQQKYTEISNTLNIELKKRRF